MIPWLCLNVSGSTLFGIIQNESKIMGGRRVENHALHTCLARLDRCIDDAFSTTHGVVVVLPRVKA